MLQSTSSCLHTAYSHTSISHAYPSLTTTYTYYKFPRFISPCSHVIILPCLTFPSFISTYSHVSHSQVSCLHAPMSHTPKFHFHILPCLWLPHLILPCPHTPMSHSPIPQEFGIVKVSHLTKLRTGIQALNPSLHSGPGAIKRARQFRETR